MDTSNRPSSEKLRHLVSEWVKSQKADHNLRYQALQESSIYTNQRVFDDHSNGLKLYVTKIVKYSANHKRISALTDIDCTFDDDEFLLPPGYKVPPIVKTFEDVIIENASISRSSDDSQISQDYSLDELDGLDEVLYDPDQEGYYTNFESKLMDEDYYELHYKVAVSKLLRNPVYKKLFDNEFVENATRKYLRTFYAFTDKDFDHGHQYPFANYFMVDTHISLAFYFAQYLDERKKIVDCFESLEGAQASDALGVKHQVNILEKEIKNLVGIKRRMDSSSYYGRKLNLTDKEMSYTFDRIITDLLLNLWDLKVYKRSEKTACELLLVSRIASDLYSLAMFKTKYPVVDSESLRARITAQKNGWSTI